MVTSACTQINGSWGTAALLTSSQANFSQGRQTPLAGTSVSQSAAWTGVSPRDVHRGRGLLQRQHRGQPVGGRLRVQQTDDRDDVQGQRGSRDDDRGRRGLRPGA
ncbi:hypothetical protein [Streptomyces echinatus]|uniref:hypothetical protein n=1 Tax=Streptomyces echinatus TaxID=67293 RepID=UPI0031EE70C5